RLTCPDCGTTTCARLPEGVPAGHFSPSNQGVLATLAGGYRPSKRQIPQPAGDLLGLWISTGMISHRAREAGRGAGAPTTSRARARGLVEGGGRGCGDGGGEPRR